MIESQVFVLIMLSVIIANSLLVVVLFVVLFLVVVVVVVFYFLYEVLHIRKKQNIKNYLNMFHLYAHSLPLIHST